MTSSKFRYCDYIDTKIAGRMIVSPLSKDTWESPVEICTIAKKELLPINLNATSNTRREFRKSDFIIYYVNGNENYREKGVMFTEKWEKIWEQMVRE